MTMVVVSETDLKLAIVLPTVSEETAIARKVKLFHYRSEEKESLELFEIPGYTKN